MKFLCVAILASVTAAAADSPGGVTWYSITAENGAAIGYASQEIVPDASGREIIETQEDGVQDEGEKTPYAPWFSARTGIVLSRRMVLTQDAAGQTTAVTTHLQIGPDWRNDWATTAARIDGGTAEVTRRTPAATWKTAVTLPPAVRFDGGDDLLRGWNPATAPRLEFESFNIDAMEVEHVTITALGANQALRETFRGDDLIAVAWLTLDGGGRIVEVDQPAYGRNVVIKQTDKRTALYPNVPYAALTSAMTKSPYRITTEAMHGHIRYRFTFKEGIAFTAPQTGEQRVKTEPGAMTIDICADCGPGLPSDPAYLADALKPTAWLQSDAPLIKAIANPVAELDVSDTRKMEILTRTARDYLGRLDFTGHYSALDTLARRAGDCTEASVLLAALGRAAGIPTRVANGLVYSREAYHGISNTFLPHSWTLAWVDGKWRSFDSALDTFDSTHIALDVGDGDERSLSAAGQLAGLLGWDGIAEVRPAPAN